MKIKVLKNFGLDGQDLEVGSVITVNKTLFGDNEQAFRDAGLFEDYAKPDGEPEAESKPTALPDGAERIDVTEHVASVVDAPHPSEDASLAEGQP